MNFDPILGASAEVVESSPAAQQAAKKSLLELEGVGDELANLNQETVSVTIAGHAASVPLGAVRGLERILSELAAGRPVAVTPLADDELSTQEAADLVRMARPTLIRLLERGEIEYRMVGTHRRVRLASLLEYQRRSATPAAATVTRERRIAALREMAELSPDAERDR
jgi:excisionase family DNA binding protein